MPAGGERVVILAQVLGAAACRWRVIYRFRIYIWRRLRIRADDDSLAIRAPTEQPPRGVAGGTILKLVEESVRLRRVPDQPKVIQGPWRHLDPPRARKAAAAPVQSGTHTDVSHPPPRLADRPELTANKMMLGFVVRELASSLGRPPSPQELVAWANHQLDQRGEFCLFGRPITVEEARVILKHPGRPVTVRPERMRLRASGEVQPVAEHGDLERSAECGESAPSRQRPESRQPSAECGEHQRSGKSGSSN